MHDRNPGVVREAQRSKASAVSLQATILAFSPQRHFGLPIGGEVLQKQEQEISRCRYPAIRLSDSQ